MTEVELSVVIPCRNAAATLGEQLAALAAQEWDGTWEIVVVDNGSDDGTGDLARTWPLPVPLTVVREERPGINVARNAGVGAARGRSIAFCDGDDVVAEGWVAALGEALRSHDYVTGPVEIDRLNPPVLAASRGRQAAGSIPSFYGAFTYGRGCNLGVTGDALRSVGGFEEDPAFMDDIELSLRLVERGIPLHFVEEAVVHYRYRPGFRALWRQGGYYGVGRVGVYRRARAQGMPVPARFAGWRSYAWMVVNLGSLLRRESRAPWIWVLANRWGHIRGSLHHRTVFL